MSRRLHLGTPARLATLFIVVTTIPLAVLGWLGHRSLNQDRDLERTRLEKTLEQTIALLVRELDSTFERVKAGGMTDPALLLETLGSSATVVHIDPEGEVATEGAPLLYHARLPADEIDDDRLKAAQYAEFRAGDLDAASAAYRRAALASDPRVRASALVGLARCLTRQRHPQDALAAYADLASLSGTPAAGFPAELVARRERAALLTGAVFAVSTRSGSQNPEPHATICRQNAITSTCFPGLSSPATYDFQPLVLAEAAVQRAATPAARGGP